MKILIVDDIGEDRRLLRYIAERQGHEVFEAANGLEGLRMASSACPELIISDALMPVMDGFQFLRLVKADEVLKPIRFIFYSATYKGDQDVRLGLALGADAYIIKPKEPKELWQEVEAVLRNISAAPATTPVLIEEEEEYLKRYSEIVACKLEQKLREIEEAKARIEQSERRTTILNRIAQLFLTIPDDEVFGEVLTVVLEVMDSRFGIYGYISDHGDLVIPSLTRDVWSECRVYDKTIVFPQSAWGQSLWGRALREKKSFRADGPFQTPAGHIGIDNFLTAPLLYDDKAIGILSVANKQGGYTDKDQELLEGIAANISPILNARMQRDRHDLKRRQAEESLRANEAFIRKILETVDEGFVVVDRDYRILSANRAFCVSAGRSEAEVLGRFCHEISHQCQTPCFNAKEKCAVKHTFATGEPYAVSHTHLTKDGSKCFVEIKSYPITDAAGLVVSAIETVNDVTEEKQLEEQLRHAQKLEALGTLAGCVAHDFNNILNVIIGYAGLLEDDKRQDDTCKPFLGEILSAAQRATRLTQSLLIFSRKQQAELKPIDLNELVRGMGKMVLRLIGEDIMTKITLFPGQLMVMGDYCQLEQVVMNFATNARDAMPDGGSLAIETNIITIDDDFVHSHGVGEPGEYALIAVTDSGTGMDEKTRERIFEPFFTTKEAGKGTGLGLAIVYGIVKQHNGHVTCHSEKGRGTTFTVYLPRTQEDLLDKKEAKAPAIRGGAETILIADDDADIRKYMRAALEMYGYTVIEAKDGIETVSTFLANKDKISLILLDVIMPGKSGNEAFQEIKAVCPHVKVLFSSGYPEETLTRKKILEDGFNLLKKPARLKDLLVSVRTILDLERHPD